MPGFWLQDDDGKRLAVSLFTKAPKAAITAVLPAIKTASKGDKTGACVLVPSTVEGRKRYVLQPNGAAMKAWEAAQDNGTAVEEPCGRLGIAMVGDRYFEVMPRHPDVVMFVNMGSEIQIFDPATLRVIPKP